MLFPQVVLSCRSWSSTPGMDSSYPDTITRPKQHSCLCVGNSGPSNGTALLASVPKHETEGIACLGLRTSAAATLLLRGLQLPLFCCCAAQLGPCPHSPADSALQ